MDIGHWEFIGLVFGLALGLVEMSGWKMNRYLRHGIGFAGLALAATCVILLFGFSGATLRSPIVLPSDKPPVIPIPVISPQPNRTISMPTKSAELEALREYNAKLKAENTRLRKIKTPHVTAALAMPSARASATPILLPSKISPDDCDALIGAQRLLDSATRELTEAFGTTKYYAALDTETQAATNLENLKMRLCAKPSVYILK